MHYRLLPLLLILLPLGCVSLPEDVTLRDEARLLWDMGRDAEAVARLEGALAVDPDDIESQIMLGSLLHGMGRVEEAVARFRLAIEISPDAYEPRYGLGALLSQLERYDEAESSLQRALELRPGDVPVLVQLAENAYRNERYAECRMRYDEVVDLLERRFTQPQLERLLVAASMERSQLCEKQATAGS